jgi:predicted glycogen debranching enzyme
MRPTTPWTGPSGSSLRSAVSGRCARLTLIEEVWPALKQSIAAHVEGTDYDIRMTEDGLLTAGDETTQLTWMDAKVEDWVVTPRHGKAVEINGLWYNALKISEYFARKMGDAEAAREYGGLARRPRSVSSGSGLPR